MTDMTTFEALILLAIIAIEIIFVIHSNCVIRRLKEIVDRKYANWEQLRKIETHTNFLCDISHKLDNIEVIILDAMRDIRLADKIVGSGFQNGFPPCYAPNGICTNPQMDCINCPKRGTSDTWSTNIVKED